MKTSLSMYPFNFISGNNTKEQEVKESIIHGMSCKSDLELHVQISGPDKLERKDNISSEWKKDTICFYD